MPLDLQVIRASEFVRVSAEGHFDLAASTAALATIAHACQKRGVQHAIMDPQGTSWVMKSASLIKDPNQKFEDLKNLDSRLKLPTGWKFRSPVLEQDLTRAVAPAAAPT